MKSENLNFLEHSGALRACNGTALPLVFKSNLCHFNPLHTPTYHFCNDQLIIYSYINVPSMLHEGKFHPRIGHEWPEEEWSYSSTVSLTSALDGIGWSSPCLSSHTLGKDRYALYRRVGGPQGRSGRVRKNSLSKGFEPRTFQHIASRHTDWAIPVHKYDILCYNVYRTCSGADGWDTAIQVCRWRVRFPLGSFRVAL